MMSSRDDERAERFANPQTDEGRRDETPAAAYDPGTDVREDERARYGGVKMGTAFFGWLTATGMSVLLTAVLAAAGAALGVATGTDLGQAANQASQDPETIGIAGAIGIAVILLISYYCGGYVAGRMARFDGARQGFAVWVWAILIAIVVAVVGVVAGTKYDIFSRLDNFPRIPVETGRLTTAGVLVLIGAAVLALIGAVLGGMAGMRFHRRVDDARTVVTHR